MKLRVAAMAALACAPLIALASACGDDDDNGIAPRDAGVFEGKASLPPATTGSPNRDSAVPDVKVDASFPEAWDRSKSARDASLEASTKYCDPNDTGVGQFCWDFTFNDGITGWNDILEDGGVHVLVGGKSGEPLRALQSTVFKEAGAGPRWVSLRYTINIDDIPDAAAGITLSFSFRASAVGTAAVIGALQIGTTAGPVIRGLEVYPSCTASVPGIPCVGENAYDAGTDAGGTDLERRRPYDPAQWYRARIHLQPSGVGTGNVTWASTMTVGDKVVAQHDTAALPKTNVFPSTVNLYVGAFDTTIAGQTVVEIDDILLE